MFQRFLVVFAILALVMASAGTVPAPGSTFRVNISQPSVVKGADLKVGEYTVSMGTEKVTFTAGKIAVDAPVKIETAPEKFKVTAVRYVTENGKNILSEIRVGGTTTRLLFN
jgi:phage baseplate assembly protein gpV